MIIAEYVSKGNRFPVEVAGAFTTGDGRKMASVRALQGQPFDQYTHGGWTTSATANVAVDRLENVRQQSDRPTLLDLALQQEREAWPTGELVYLLEDKRAYLRNEHSKIMLYVRGHRKGLPVFYLNPLAGVWERSRHLEIEYQGWANEARASV